ncbi:MAG: nuclear transport factor 2 family protein [Saccharopolyspora sp.]|uniref:nuclear transport factor 2 family protein n=1 Tax=Saccharopolyspora TaxID=1835 RepID=UPI00190B112A|nr:MULTISPECIES: nuclear transport factor 2 family protein [unclassified Saccharopolyspora]MBK0868041.1 nuclear transport factor 2 family protein [Saccharopolyspora sp. HNM0986]MBQ6640995.1 nuclear transport factor 2 family protein [Saccharopolyspora sp.]
MSTGTARGEIEDVLSRYALGYDEGDLALLEEVFTEDAVLTIRIADGDLIGPFEGRAAIIGMMRDTAQTQQDKRKHVISNLVLDERGDTATARTYLTLFSVADGQLTALTTGRYETELRSTGDGWRLDSVHIALDLPY